MAAGYKDIVTVHCAMQRANTTLVKPLKYTEVCYAVKTRLCVWFLRGIIMYMATKKWYKSKTVWIAILQAIAGIILLIATEYPDAEIIASAMMVKSVLDIIVRGLTSATVEV